jgi:hypothetical protein
VALVLPHADIIVCLDGKGGIAAACPPSELSAVLSLTMSNQVGNESVRSYLRSEIGDTDNEEDSPVEDGEVKGEGKRIRKSESNGFFDLLMALPRMSKDDQSLSEHSTKDIKAQVVTEKSVQTLETCKF